MSTEKWWKWPWQMPKLLPMDDMPKINLTPGQKTFIEYIAEISKNQPATFEEFLKENEAKVKPKIGEKVKRGETPVLF